MMVWKSTSRLCSPQKNAAHSFNCTRNALSNQIALVRPTQAFDLTGNCKILAICSSACLFVYTIQLLQDTRNAHALLQRLFVYTIWHLLYFFPNESLYGNICFTKIASYFFFRTIAYNGRLTVFNISYLDYFMTLFSYTRTICDLLRCDCVYW
jgi:hypothetical protein